MRCCIFILFILGFYRGAVEGLDNPVDDIQDTVQDAGEAVRQGLVHTMDGKKGVHCLEIKDNQCPRKEITFWLYTKDRQTNPHQLDPFDENTLRNAPFVHGAPLKILVHGYTMNRDTAINEVLRPAYFNNHDYNIVSVDWGAVCPEHCYKPAALSVPYVGHCLAAFINKLMELHPGVFSEVHLLGHSLGAHVSSWASKDVVLDRVTEFDPALPLFSNEDENLYVKPVGRYVDVWHSNSGLKGREDVSGTVDIYFNDGMDQPGCKCDTSCSHLRAVQYYAETVADQHPLTAFPCKGWDEFKNGECPTPRREDLADFGEQDTRGRTGPFLAFTNSRSPFIIDGNDYTDADRLKKYRESHDEHCPAHDILSTIGKVVDL